MGRLRTLGLCACVGTLMSASLVLRASQGLGVPAGKLIHPTRVALTGRAVSPGLFEVMEMLGRERTLARLDRMIATLTDQQR